MSEDALSIRYMRVLVDGVERRGVSRDCFLAAAQWEPQQLCVVEGRVARAELGRLIELAIEVTGDPALGLHVLEGVRPDSVDLVGRLVAHAANLREALDWLLRLHALLGDERRFDLIESGCQVTLRYQGPSGLSAQASRFLAEMHMTGNHLLLRHFARHARPVRVCFEHAAPSYRSEHERIFGGAERFGQPLTGFVFDRALMGAARRYHDEEFHRALRELADNRILRLARAASCGDRVQGFLATHEAPGKATMATIARALGMSARSLRRRLAAEGRSYHDVVTDALATKARRLLSLEQRTIDETAQALGYADTSAFHRAFKRWTGTTPRAWRLQGK